MQPSPEDLILLSPTTSRWPFVKEPDYFLIVVILQKLLFQTYTLHRVSPKINVLR